MSFKLKNSSFHIAEWNRYFYFFFLPCICFCRNETYKAIEVEIEFYFLIFSYVITLEKDIKR